MAKGDFDRAVQQVAGWLRLFIQPGQVTELRALNVRTPSYKRAHTVAGFFDYEHLDKMAGEALKITSSASGVYFVPNPINPNCLALRANTVDVTDKDELTTDAYIIRRHWMIVDADPIRSPKQISSSDEEKARAWDTIIGVRDYFRLCGWPEPIVADSGNGFHLFYTIDLPVADDDQVKKVLAHLAQKFNNEFVEIDPKLFNPSRIIKLPGTVARKGDQIPGRPHRRAKILEVPPANGDGGAV